MNIDPLKTLAAARPWRPFTIHLDDGDRVRVTHPERLAWDESVRTIFVGGPTGGFVILDREHITRLVVDEPDAPRADANGS